MARATSASRHGRRAVSPATIGILFGLRPFAVRAVLFCAPVPILHVRGRPLVDIELFRGALSPGTREPVDSALAKKTGPGRSRVRPGPRITPVQRQVI